MAIIHETILKDIIDIVGDVEDFTGVSTKALTGNDYKFKSLTKSTNDLILVFPVLCTKGISIETASLLTKAIEKNCVTLLQMLLASIQITDVDNVNDYISKVHSNISIGNKITVDDFITVTDKLSECGYIKIDNDVYNKFKEEINNIAKVSLNEYSLSDFECYKNSNGIETILQEKTYRPGHKEKMSKEERLYKDKLAGKERQFELDKLAINQRNKERLIKQQAKYNDDLAKKDRAYQNVVNDSNRKFVEYMANSDIKKANELMPTKVLVSFKSRPTDGGEIAEITNAVIGVKCKLYPVDSLEIIERISSKYADTNWVRELVRASTGEISFWRDFVFAVDRAKIDAINSSKKGSSATMFKVLERRATKNRLSKWKANKADCAPITTLIINQDEVEYLKKDYDIDMENRNIAIKLMESYNLMGLTIVDEPAESASFIWDEGNNANFETLSFRNLERESSDSNYKKVINLMTKISR